MTSEQFDRRLDSLSERMKAIGHAYQALAAKSESDGDLERAIHQNMVCCVFLEMAKALLEEANMQ